MFGRKKVAMVAAEFLGTAILAMAAIAVSKSAVGVPYFVAAGVGLTLALLVLVIGSVSGAHVNPVVTLGLWMLRKVNTSQAIVYIAAQFLGGLMAWRLYVYLVDNTIANIGTTAFDWRVFVAETMGAFVFTFAVAAAVFQKYEGLRLAAVIGTGLFLGVLLAGIASNGVVNPAVALGVQSWSWEYVVGPIAGAVLGMNLYAMLFAGSPIAVDAARNRGRKRK